MVEDDYNSEIITTTKEEKCLCCERTIPHGIRIRHEYGAYQGSAYDFITCKFCNSIVSDVREFSEFFGYEEFCEYVGNEFMQPWKYVEPLGDLSHRFNAQDNTKLEIYIDYTDEVLETIILPIGYEEEER